MLRYLRDSSTSLLDLWEQVSTMNLTIAKMKDGRKYEEYGNIKKGYEME